MGLAEATIKLLHHQVGAKGFLILVDARDDEDRIDSILLKNRGMPRTVMVTEQVENYPLGLNAGIAYLLQQ